MINPAQKPPHLNRREALQTVGATVALAASGRTGAASAATPTINASDRYAGGFWPNGTRLAVSLSLMFDESLTHVRGWRPTDFGCRRRDPGPD